MIYKFLKEELKNKEYRQQNIIFEQLNWIICSNIKYIYVCFWICIVLEIQLNFNNEKISFNLFLIKMV